MQRKSAETVNPVATLARQTWALLRRDWEVMLLLAALIAAIAMALMSRQWELFVTLFGHAGQPGDAAVRAVLQQINVPYWVAAALAILYAHCLALVVFARYAAFGGQFARDGVLAMLGRAWRATLQVVLIFAMILLPMAIVNMIVIMLHGVLGNFLTSILLLLVVAVVLFVRLAALAAVHAAALDIRLSALSLLADLKNRPLGPSFSLFLGTFALLQLPDFIVTPFLIGMIDDTVQGKWALLLTIGLGVFFGMILQMIGLLLARPLLARPGEIRL